MNNINLEAVKKFSEEAQKNPETAKKVKIVSGEWNFKKGGPQFKSEIKFQSGAAVVEADSPPFMGGAGLKPDPVQYCLFGLAACFASTFASICAENGVELSKLKVTAESKQNLAKSLGLSEEPIVEEVKLLTEVQSGAGREKIKEIEKLAAERCPGVYCLTNPIKLVTEIKMLK